MTVGYEKTELERLFDILDAVGAEYGWTLMHFGTSSEGPRRWNVSLGHHEAVADTAEEACRAVLRKMLDEAEAKIQEREERARAARDGAARLRRLIEGSEATRG